MEIGDATSADARAIAQLGYVIHERNFARRPDWFKPPSVDDCVAHYAAWLGRRDVIGYIATDHDALIGYVLTRIVQRSETPVTWAQVIVEVRELGVRASAQRSGVGHALFGAVRNLATRESASLVTLTNWEFNREAHCFFEAEGVRLTRRHMSMTWPQH